MLESQNSISSVDVFVIIPNNALTETTTFRSLSGSYVSYESKKEAAQQRHGALQWTDERASAVLPLSSRVNLKASN